MAEQSKKAGIASDSSPILSPDEIFKEKTEAWILRCRNNLKGFGEIVKKDEPDAKPRRVRIALLDTGIRRDNSLIRSQLRNIKRRDSIKEQINFLDQNSPEDTEDMDKQGHGTLNMLLLLRTAPEADIYFARVARSKDTVCPKAIVKVPMISGQLRVVWAIKHATTIWKVDIIAMPLKASQDCRKFRSAIKEAYSVHKILIAGASNEGGNAGRAYPASDERVICMHALDGLGNNFPGLNPTPHPSDDNFGTLGLDIRFPFNEDSKGGQKQNEEETSRSGTSYATAVAAGITATILAFLYHADFDNHFNNNERTLAMSNQGMKKIFRRIAGNKRDGFDYIAPWNLWLDGLTPSDICSVLKAALISTT
ncbi:Intracellular serine protease [Tolypocladium paradoxum]|uniref:Intracellular serine protease n=1 Tax=Tolypocladium paradoxum TaxID=94208 RepID=A0A2S4L7Z6_9HYPO|nr:Intracellular serine protease [Tolypocladium paradoxum]